MLERAVLCGCQAPNHKRTEPFSFERMIALSPAREPLADIFYHVTLCKQQQKQKNNNNNNKSMQQQDLVTLKEMEQTAQRKRDKWSQTPAFLVTVVSTARNNK